MGFFKHRAVSLQLLSLILWIIIMMVAIVIIIIIMILTDLIKENPNPDLRTL